ncbi:hypothetical protein SISSUDRAFT_232670 [Sistotremastrum suecicum HHB10207 ss-3]|uniref:Uncharacterized protein n=1 Tax=Sistotremastrum suecicum HHB10207 ss-3 TaxID=1314776 RepID=A0A166GGU6_9AGAM|nr:hypothetical protein SISSUDRAFT_232670 [Sistotremastrum suecicum HHB10207 ss-3]
MEGEKEFEVARNCGINKRESEITANQRRWSTWENPKMRVAQELAQPTKGEATEMENEMQRAIWGGIIWLLISALLYDIVAHAC